MLNHSSKRKNFGESNAVGRSQELRLPDVPGGKENTDGFSIASLRRANLSYRL